MKSHTALHTASPLFLKAIVMALVCLIAPAATIPANAAATPESPSRADQTLAASAELDVLVPGIASMAVSPVIVTAADLVTKVFGALDLPQSGQPALTSKEIAEKGVKALKVRPSIDETGIWFESDAGYRVSYSGMTPEVSAVAQFENDSLSSFGYFFIFPYSAGCREQANSEQCAFCGSLLQEMNDMGSIAGVPADEDSDSGDLFNALGSYDGNHINVALREQTGPDASGRFLLVVEVKPGAYNLYDGVMALSE